MLVESSQRARPRGPEFGAFDSAARTDWAWGSEAAARAVADGAADQGDRVLLDRDRRFDRGEQGAWRAGGPVRRRRDGGGRPQMERRECARAVLRLTSEAGLEEILDGVVRRAPSTDPADAANMATSIRSPRSSQFAASIWHRVPISVANRDLWRGLLGAGSRREHHHADQRHHHANALADRQPLMQKDEREDHGDHGNIELTTEVIASGPCWWRSERDVRGHVEEADRDREEPLRAARARRPRSSRAPAGQHDQHDRPERRQLQRRRRPEIDSSPASAIRREDRAEADRRDERQEDRRAVGGRIDAGRLGLSCSREARITPHDGDEIATVANSVSDSPPPITPRYRDRRAGRGDRRDDAHRPDRQRLVERRRARPGRRRRRSPQA